MWIRSTVVKAAAFLSIAAPLASARNAYAGPPFQTDDPEPVEYRHFEMYAFSLSDSTGRNAGGTVFTAPGYEVNYGSAPNLQLHLVVPFTTVFQPESEPAYFGISDAELGFKYRFLPERAHVPQVGIFPFFELPTGNAEETLGVGKTWYRMPVWLQKSWGPEDRKWTSYGGGGYTVVPQSGYSDFPFAGWLIQRDISRKLMLGTEVFGHGAEGAAAANGLPPCWTSAERTNSRTASTCSLPADARCTASRSRTATWPCTGRGVRAAPRKTKTLAPRRPPRVYSRPLCT